MNVEHTDEGLLFHMSNEIKMLVKYHSAAQLLVEMWRHAQLIPPDIGNLYMSTFRAKLVKAAQDAFGKANTSRIAEDIGNAALYLSSPNPNAATAGKTMRDLLEEKAGSSVAERLVLYARKAAAFFHTPEQEAYASVTVGRHVENYRVRSRRFRLWLQNEFWSREREKIEEAELDTAGALYEGAAERRLPEVVREQALLDAQRLLEGLATFEGSEHEVFIRAAGGHDGEIYLDLVDEEWRAVRIAKEGWYILNAEDLPVKFIRPKGMAPLPVPTEENAGVEALRGLLNLQGEDGERSFRLILAWLMQALRPRGPYPALVLLGERGSAKSTAARILRSLVDPSTVPLRTMPRSPHDLYIDAVSAWTISLDNISSLPRWLSDTLCMLATGGGFSTRTLFTDREQELFEAMRPVILNGITAVVTSDDLVQRSLIVRLPTLAKGSYKTERAIQRELQAVRPQILAALLDAAVEGLRRIDSVKVEALPRMGDFASWAVATEEALGGEPGSFMEALGASDEEGAQQALEASPLAEPVYELARTHPDGWEGTASEMLARLRDFAEEDLQHTREWPKAANVLSNALRRLAPLFREAGQVQIEQLSRADARGSKRWLVKPIKDPV